MESLTSSLYRRSLDDADTESDSKLGFVRLGHEHSLRIAHPDPPDQLRLRAAHAASTLPPASLDPTQGPLVGHVAAITSIKAIALRAAGVFMVQGLALCVSIALRSRSDPATSLRSRNRPKSVRN